ncbi:hypothetical protein RU03_05630 [Pseudomonas simiae]|uniref:hypothetical protein n=1 Tax=Pseudomonas TaxID=286 RepID=UPI0005AC7994|nr:MULTISPECIES: hypothetical protein [Pseudomonas]KIQ13705.1 hypothetical protein RU03_05630 [Pseudomonas simiae]
MDEKPSNMLLADQSGLTIAEVGTYLTELVLQPDGSWIAYFGTEIDRSPDARSKLNAARTLLIPAWLAKHWVDRNIG